MIKLNDICIQYTAWCRRDTHTATSLTHTPWSTRLGPARSQHTTENRMRLSDLGDRPAERDRRVGRDVNHVPEGSLVKIKTIRRSMHILPDARVESTPESTRRDDNIVKQPCVHTQGRKWKGGVNRIWPSNSRINPCVLHTVEINILIFSLGRYAHRAPLTRTEKNRRKSER